MIDSAFSPFDTVVIAGGTHGNERTGVSLVQHWRQNPVEVQRAGFTTRLLLANPEAARRNRRFIDRDLNRSFLLREGMKDYESGRAREIAAWMKQAGGRTFAIDLHSSTACMGITLITNSDPVNLALAAAVQTVLRDARIYCFADGDRINSCLRAAADGGIGVEIGPIPQGLLRHDALAVTREVVRRILDAVATFNRDGLHEAAEDRPVYRHDRNVAYPEVPPDAPPAFIHPELEGRDYAPLNPGQPIFQDLAGRTWIYEGAAPRCPVFINEAAYYHENVAFSLTRKVSLASLAAF